MEYGNDLPNIWQEWRKTDISYIFSGTLSKKFLTWENSLLEEACIVFQWREEERRKISSCQKKNFFLKFFYAKTRVVPKQRMLVVTCHDLLDVRCTFFFVNFFPEIGAKWRHSKKTRPKMTKTWKRTYFGHKLSSLNDEKLFFFFKTDGHKLKLDNQTKKSSIFAILKMAFWRWLRG